MKRLAWAAILTAQLTITGVSTAVFAQTLVKHPPVKPRQVHVIAQSYYVCNTCQVYFSPSVAKKDHYKDSMGHKLVKVNTIPIGYMDGVKMGM